MDAKETPEKLALIGHCPAFSPCLPHQLAR